VPIATSSVFPVAREHAHPRCSAPKSQRSVESDSLSYFGLPWRTACAGARFPSLVRPPRVPRSCPGPWLVLAQTSVAPQSRLTITHDRDRFRGAFGGTEDMYLPTPFKFVTVMTLVALAATACSSPTESPATASTGSQSEAMSPSASSAPTDPLVGRWEQMHVCQKLVDALNADHLGPTAPQAVEEFFPDQTPKQLSKKTDLCAGSTPFRHAHFFDALGQFGSLDENSNQVDDGSYTIIDQHSFRLGHSTFHYRITGDGNTLRLDPVITEEQRREALAHPLEFSDATWMEAVSYAGTTWKRVPCDGWC
jgi:hypothetical protein